MTPDAPHASETARRPDIARDAAVAWARGAMAVEAVVPAFAPLFLGLGLFLASAWLGVFALLPGPFATLAAAAALLALAGWSVARFRRGRARARGAEPALSRVERDAAIRRRALFHLEDRPLEATDPMAAALWAASQDRAADERRARRLRPARIDWRAIDPFGARWALALLIALSGVAAGDQRWSRLGGALHGTQSTTSLRVDAWIEPPRYTGKPPRSVSWSEGGVLAVPENSVLRLAVAGARRAPRVATPTGRERLEKRGAGHAGAVPLTTSGRVAIAGRSVVIDIIRDAPPRAEIVGEAETDEAGALVLPIFLDDDYGVVGTRLELRLAADQDFGPDQPEIDDTARTKVIDVALRARGRDRRARVNLQDHPWAGLAVEARLVALDAAEQEGRSEAVRLALPQRAFQTSEAKAVIEQRRVLTVSGDVWRRPARALEAMTLTPEIYSGGYAEHLHLRRAYWRVLEAADETDTPPAERYADLVDDLWNVALRLEDGAVETARRALKAAEEALREALERGAPQEEIDALVEQLRQAMADYIAALEASGQEPGDDSAMGDILAADDLEERLKRIRELSKAGEGREARDALAELSEILEALQARTAAGGRGNRSGDSKSEAEDEALNELGDLIDRQRALADQTYEEENAAPPGPEGDAGADARRDELADTQRAIAEAAEALGESLSGLSERSRGRLGEAEAAMREAEQALGDPASGSAGESQSDALSSLRAAAAALSEDAEARRAAEAGRSGSGSPGEGGAPGPVDPLGRPLGGGEGERNGLEATRSERVRALVDALRERLAEPGLDPAERAYIERLLRRF
ncbi:MAG: DUF4175 family protein [Pseudomonadota bacterium]